LLDESAEERDISGVVAENIPRGRREKAKRAPWGGSPGGADRVTTSSLEHFRALLQQYMAKKGLRSTDQRRLIIDTFFTAPNHVVPGGVTGIATMLNDLTGLPIGVGSFLLNLPLILLGWKFLGKKFVHSTLRTLVILTVLTDTLAVVLPEYTGNMLLASIFGGLLIGAGLGVVFLRGSTTGGSDIVGRLLLLRYPHIQLGKMLLYIDFAVILAAGFYFSSMEAALYALASVYTVERALDTVLYGDRRGVIAWALVEDPETTARLIMEKTGRGVTFLMGEGGFTGGVKRVIMCAMSENQFPIYKKVVKECDPDAFIMSSPSNDIIGEGFHPMRIEG
jgi:uncharacterized membrane-anchored protein YitT (DUF2179 family)